MVLISVDGASNKLKGILKRWFLEPKPGIFIGTVNATVRQEIWKMIADESIQGALLVYSMNNEQGFKMEMLGEPTRSIVNFDGIQLIKYN